MNRILINYADGGIIHFINRELNSKSGMKFGFNTVKEFVRADLNEDFVSANARILNIKLGSGLWLWKPYVIYEAMKLFNDGDFLFYSDCGIEFISDIDPLVKIADRDEIMSFVTNPGPNNHEFMQTKEDVFVLMGLTEEKYRNAYCRLASYSCYKIGDKSRAFVKEWLDFAQNYDIISNDLGQRPNHPGFRFCRHDQSIYSLLSTKHNLPQYRDCSQWGEPYELNKEDYGRILNHHRMRGVEEPPKKINLARNLSTFPVTRKSRK
jgi:hypothetical protein